MQAIDDQTKGQPAGHTLFCLWARSPDHALITIENPVTFASEAGFVGARAVDTWRRRMKKLRELSFIVTKPGPSGEFHYVLLLNPNGAMEWLREHQKIQDGLYARFLDRLAEIGALGEVEEIRAIFNAQRAAKAAVPPPPPGGQLSAPSAAEVNVVEVPKKQARAKPRAATGK